MKIKKINLVCNNCNKSYVSGSNNSKFCSIECRKEYMVKAKGAEGEAYVICQLCERAVSNITGMHLRTHHKDYTPEQYRKEFPDSQVIPTLVLSKISSGAKNAGARMREPEHRKRLSEQSSGSNNPMHSSKTTEKFRKSISPFSPEFYLSRDPNLSENEAIEKAKAKSASVEIVSWTQKGYWIKKGYTEEEAISIISKKQKTL